MALLRLGRLDQLVSLAQLSQLLRAPLDGMATPAPRPSANATSAVRLPETAPEVAKKKELSGPEAAASGGPTPLTAATLAQVWPEVLRQVGRFLASDLESAGFPAISGPNSLVVRFEVGYNSQRKHCQEPTSVSRIEDTLRRVTGQAWKIRI